jgi:hypothetical protein
VLTVNGRLTVKGSITLGGASTAEGGKSGKLVIDNGKVIVENGANINATTASRIELAKTSSTLTFDGSAKLNVVGSLASDEKVVGTAKALVVLPSTITPALTIGKDNIADPAKLGKETDYTDGPKLASVTTSADANTKLVSGSTVVYSGTEALIGIDIPNDATLIITGTVNQANNPITATDTGKLEVAATGKLVTNAALPASAANIKNDGVIETTNSSLDHAGLKALVWADGDGTIVLNIGISGVTAPLVLNQNLETGAGGSITYTSGAAAAFSASAEKTVTIRSNGKLTLGDTITSLGNNVTVINEGSDPAAISIGNIDALGYILSLPSAPRNVTLSGEVSIVSGITVKNGTTLTIKESAKLTAPSGKTFTVDAGAKVVVASGGTLDLSTLTVAGAVKLDGTIEVSGTLKVPMPESNGTTPEIAFGNNGSIKVNWGGAVVIGGSNYIGASSALYNWTDTANAASGQYVTLKKNNEMFLHGNLTTANSITVNTEQKATIDKGATLTLGASNTDGRFFIDGNVLVSGTIKVEATSTSPQKAWVELRHNASKLTLLPGGKLDIPATSSVYTNSGTGTSTPKVSVHEVTNDVPGTITKATVSTSGSVHTLTKSSAWGVISVVLGNLKLDISADDTSSTSIIGTNAGASAAKGTLTAGPATAIVFAKQ